MKTQSSSCDLISIICKRLICGGVPDPDLYTAVGREEFYNRVLDDNKDTPRYIQDDLHEVIESMHDNGLEDSAVDVINQIKQIMDDYGVTFVDTQGSSRQQRALIEIYDYIEQNVPAAYWENVLSEKAIIKSMNTIDRLMEEEFYTNDFSEEAIMNAGGDIARLFKAKAEDLSQSEAAEIAANNTQELIDFLVTHAGECQASYADLLTDPETASILVDAMIVLL